MALSTIAISASAKAGVQSKEDANIIEFVEAPWGLGMTLFPVQKVILKAHYGLELDDTKKFKISDWRRQHYRDVTEREYLKLLFEEGRCNIGEVVPGKERREMVLSIGRRSGKCVLGDTLVLTDKGIYRIDELGDPNGEEYQPLEITIAQEGKNKTSQSKFFYNGGVKPVFKFKTHCGYKLGGTGNHRVKVLSKEGNIEWKYLSDIQLGDVVCIHRETNLWGKGNTLTLEEAYSLGLEKRDCLPNGILTSNKDVVEAYLKGVFKKELTTYSNNEVYLHQLQILLLNCGLISKLGIDSLTVMAIDYMGSYYYDPITEITTDTQPVYDLNVPDGAMFVANGMTNHNTTISACIAAYETYKLIKKNDPQEYYGLPASNNIQIISVATDKDQAGLLYNEVSGHFRNCFAYETEVITDQGIKKIGAITGTSQYLLTREGVWVKAPIRSFGRQKLFKLTLIRQGVLKEIYTTENHRWFILYKGSYIECLTKDLKVNDALEPYKDEAWVVKDIEETDRYEEVYCATVEGHGNFILEGNIVTGNCAFFGPYTANNTQSYARFQTPKDVERYGRYIEDPSAKATLKVTFRSCVAKGLRGAGNICVIMDEIAHFTETGQSGAEEVYNAVVPSTSAYSPKDPNDRRIPVGPVEGRVISISSPLGKQGLFYKLFNIGMQGGKASENMLCVQAPTWEVNPTVPATEFEKHYLKNPAVFFTEYGGEFTDRTRGWIEDSKDLLACVDVKHKTVDRGIARKPYYMGVDVALVGDGSAIAIGHLDGDNLVLDKVDMIKAGEGKFRDKERLDFDDVADWVLDYTKRFYIVEGIFDQWAGIPFEQALNKRGLTQLKTQQMTKQLTSQMFQNFKDMMWDKRLVLYNRKNCEIDGHEPYIQELLELQQTVHSKNLITVEAPQTEGKHDDMSDAIVRMFWVASQNVGRGKVLSIGRNNSGGLIRSGLVFGRQGSNGSEVNRGVQKVPKHSIRGVINKLR